MKKLTLLFTAIWTALLLTPPAVYAADIALGSSCSLADAIIAANHNRPEGGCPAGRVVDTIILTQDITLRDELPKITSAIIIEGSGYTISGDHRWRIFYNDGGALTIKDLTMTKGYVDVGIIRGVIRRISEVIQTAHAHLTNDESFIILPPSDTFGGAIVNDGELSVVNSTFSHNSADSGGAIYNRDGTVSISDSAFSNNTAGWGGAINDYGELSIVNSSFSGNSADISGGAIFNAGKLSIVNSSFSHNLADVGGAVFNAGKLSIVNSTFSHNSADTGGGGIENYGELSIGSNTFSDNSANFGGVIRTGDALSMVNSIIAGGDGDACLSFGGLKHNISNFIQDGSCSPAFEGDPMLGELVEPEDGSPAYYPLLEGSPAIDAADDDYCPATDQIGTARPQGGGCDIGAIEYIDN